MPTRRRPRAAARARAAAHQLPSRGSRAIDAAPACARTSLTDAAARGRTWRPPTVSEPMADAEVRSAIVHWAPRFIQAGVDHNDLAATTARVASWAQWLPEWRRTADRAAALARAAQDARPRPHRRRRLAARRRHAPLRQVRLAARRGPARRRDADGGARAAQRAPAARDRPRAHRGAVHGRLRGREPAPPGGAERPPLVVLVPGLDSTKEEFFLLENAFLDRGMATLSLDGPGQGEVGLSLPIRPDYEVCVTAMLDRIAGRDDLDLGRLGLFGVSLGGYYAARAAAFEPRIRAVVGLSGPYYFGEIWSGLPSLTRRDIHGQGARRRRCRGPRAGRRARPRRRLRADRGAGAVRDRPPRRRRAVASRPNASRARRRTRRSCSTTTGNHGCSNLDCEVRPALADWMCERLLDGRRRGDGERRPGCVDAAQPDARERCRDPHAGLEAGAADARRSARGCRALGAGEHAPVRDAGVAVPADVDVGVAARARCAATAGAPAPRRSTARGRRGRRCSRAERASKISSPAGGELGDVRLRAPADEHVAVRQHLDVALAVREEVAGMRVRAPQR